MKKKLPIAGIISVILIIAGAYFFFDTTVNPTANYSPANPGGGPQSSASSANLVDPGFWKITPVANIDPGFWIYSPNTSEIDPGFNSTQGSK